MPESGILVNAMASSVLVASILAGAQSIPAAGQNRDTQLAAVRELYLQSVNDESLVDSAFAILGELPERAEAAALIEAFTGALVVMRAKHAFWPGRKLAYVRRGLRTLDAAVDSDPSNAEVRYLRLVSCYYLPGLFGRSWSVREDFEALAHSVRDLRSKFESDVYIDLVRFIIENADVDESTRDGLRAEIDGISANNTSEAK